MRLSRRFPTTVVVACFLGSFSHTASAAAPPTRLFDLPAGAAEKSLKQFSEQAGKEVLFATQVAKAVRTQPVKGEMTARDAIDRMLVGTGLVVYQDEKTGVFSVRQPTEAEKKAGKAAQAGSDRPAQNPVVENERNESAGQSSDSQSSSKKKTETMKPAKNPAALMFGWIALALAPGATAETAATGIITGNVSNAATGNLLEGAKITLPQLDLSAFTDKTGRFVLTRVPAGTHELVATYLGLDPLTGSVNVVAGQRVVRDFDLTSGIYKLEAFTVRGEREGDAKAITEKRNADNVKDVTAMDSFGNLPNLAMGEVVKRLPGVAGTPSDEDQFATFNIRGMGPELNSVTIDGGLLPSWGPLRSFELHSITSTMFESLELIKGHTPDKGADSLGGTINLKTRSPLSLREKRRTTYQIMTGIAPPFLEHPPLREQHRIHPVVSLGHQEVFDLFGGDRNLGVAVNLYYSEYGVGGTNTTFDYQNTTDPAAYIWNYSTWDNHNLQKQQSLNIKADYRLTPSTKLTLALTSNDNFERHRKRLEVRASTGAATTVPSDTTGIVPGAFNEKRTVVRPTATSIIDSFMNGPRFFYLRMRRLDIGAEHEFRNLEIDYAAGITTNNLNSGDGTGGQLRMRIANTGWILDRSHSDRLQEFRANGGLDFTDPNNYRPAPNGLANTVSQNDQQVKQLRFNARYQLPIPVTTFLKTGVSWRETLVDIENKDAHRWSYIGGGPLTPDTTLMRYTEARTGQRMPQWQSHMFMDKHRPRDPSLWQEDLYFHESQKFTGTRGATETVSAAYIQAQGRLGREGLLARTGYLGGVRVEKTETDGWGWVRSRVPSTVAQQLADPAGSAARDYAPNFRQLHGEYTKSFPSIHVFHDLTPDLKARASYSTSFGRAGISELLPNETINETTQIVTVNNPALKPQTAENWDVTLEYYFGSVGSLSVGWFHKEINDYIIRNQESGIIGVGADNGFGGEYIGWSQRTSLNAGTAIAQGWEFAYQQQFSFLPGLLKGLSATANYTRITTHGDYGGTRYLTTRELGGFIPHAANFSLAWRYRKFNTRVLYNFTGEHILSFNAANPALSLFRLSRKMVNVGVGYQLNPAVSLSLDAANVLNEPQATYRGFKDRRASTLYNFVTITAGVNGRF